MLDPMLFGLLSQIERDDIVLPAMQRPFVWKEDRIYKLIDSLLRGFPIGAVMLWRTSTVQRFRRLPRDVDVELPEIFNFETSTDTGSKYLVLDGQQRLTSIFAAFKGTYAHKRLYIDALSGSSEGKDPGNEYYDCQFLSEKQAADLTKTSNGERKYLVPIQESRKVSRGTLSFCEMIRRTSSLLRRTLSSFSSRVGGGGASASSKNANVPSYTGSSRSNGLQIAA